MKGAIIPTVAQFSKRSVTMPFKSDAQRRWGHTKEGEQALGGPSKVAEWDEATKGKDLPEKLTHKVQPLKGK